MQACTGCCAMGSRCVLDPGSFRPSSLFAAPAVLRDQMITYTDLCKLVCCRFALRLTALDLVLHSKLAVATGWSRDRQGQVATSDHLQEIGMTGHTHRMILQSQLAIRPLYLRFAGPFGHLQDVVVVLAACVQHICQSSRQDQLWAGHHHAHDQQGGILGAVHCCTPLHRCKSMLLLSRWLPGCSTA